MAKKVRAVVTHPARSRQGNAGAARRPGPGPARASTSWQFCKEYNEKTATQAGQIVPAEVTVFEDRSFTFVLKTPPASDMLRKAAGIEKGSRAQKREKVGSDQPRRSCARSPTIQDARPQRRRRRGGEKHDRRQRPQHGHRGEGARRDEATARSTRKQQSLSRSSKRREALPARARRSRWPRRPRSRQVRRDGRAAPAHRPRPAPRRPAAARHRAAAARPRQDGARARLRRRRRRARNAEQAGADFVGSDDLIKQHRGRLDRLRRRPRRARHDGQGQPPRPRARPARPDAEPALRHRRRPGGHRQGRQRRPPGPRRVPPRPHGADPRADRQGQLRRGQRCSRTWRRWSTPSSRRSRPAPRASTSAASR